MADIKISDVTIGSISEIVSGDYALFLDKSATSGPQSGPGGTLKLVPVGAFRPFGTVPITEYDLNLNGIDTNQPLLNYIADAINASGPFNNIPGGRIVFRTFSVSGFESNYTDDYSVTITYFELKKGFSGASIGGSTLVTGNDLVISGGPYVRNPETNEDLFLDLGDIGSGPVEDAFNLGDGGDAWQIVGTKFITAELDGQPTIWKFVGTGFTFWGGDDAATDPEIGTATASDFLLLNEDAPVKGMSLADLWDLNIPRDLTTTPILNGSVLTYNTTTGKWEAAPPSGGTDIDPDTDIYADVTALITDQNAQEEGEEYFVTDATDFTTITSGGALVLYLGTTDGDEEDYLILSNPGGESSGISRIEESPTDTVKADKIYTRHGSNKVTQSGSRNVTLDNTNAKITSFTSEEFITDGSDLVLSTMPYSYDISGATNVTISSDKTTFSFSSSGDTYRIMYEWLGAASGWHITIKDYIIAEEIIRSNSYLFITSPTPRTEIEEGDTLNPTVEAENAESVEFFYKNLSDTWVSIDDAVNISGDIWEVASWSPTVPATAIKAVATYADTTTQEVENNLYSISIHDTFTDTNGTSITSHTPDSNLGANGWTILNGDWEIIGNTLKNESGVSGVPLDMHHDLGYADCIFKFTTPYIDAMQVILRYDSADDYLNLYKSGTLTSLTQVSGGSNNVVWSDDTNLTNGGLFELWLIDRELKIVVGNEVKAFIEIPIASSYTKFGFRRGGATSSTQIDNFTIIPIAPQPIDSTVSYTATKLGSSVIAKGFNAPKDSSQIGDFDMETVDDTNYLLYSTRDSNNDFKGLCLATSDVSDPHNWTAQVAYALEVDDIAGCAVKKVGSLFHVVYTDRTEGKLLYATGADIGSLTPQGVIKDLTGDGIYIRQSTLNYENGVWHVHSTIRTDQPAGEFGYLAHFSGNDLTSLGDIKEALSTPGFKDDTCSLTGVSVKFNEDNGYYEMFYSAYKGRDGSNFVHNIFLAISKVIDGKYVRVSDAPLIEVGGTSFDDADVGAPCRMPGTDKLYYVHNGSGTAGAGDGITYATLTED
ncbi:MAG: hypothetical protein CMC13_00195 [Flavobacteriaceae bacterium]|nr:hypothetical protein [Flavobacteriaceae bacterium]|tara:strand:- start:2122 stop:5280 length:3159 start_codon:yes stop_codon:yes gene_type:complete